MNNTYTLAVFAALLLFLLPATCFAQTVFLTEDFETDGNGSRYTLSSPFYDSAEDYFGRLQSNGTITWAGDGGQAGASIDIEADYTGQIGSFYLGGEDLDDDGGDGMDNKFLTFSDININGASDITVRFLIANGASSVCGEPTARWDADDNILVSYRKGSTTGYTSGICFYSDIECNIPGDTSNEPLHYDPNCDGDGGDGAFISNVFTEYSFTIPVVPGDELLELRFEFNADAADEEFAIDNITLEANTPPVTFVCPSLGVLTSNPPSVCAGEPIAAITVSEVENVLEVDNQETDFRIRYYLFQEATTDPYANLASGNNLGFVLGSELTDGAITIPAGRFNVNLNQNAFMYVILEPVPNDPDCRPFAELALTVAPIPEVERIFSGTVCADFFNNVPSGKLPLGGVYSGPGVTDNGDGTSYTFDASQATTDTTFVTYTFTDANGCVGIGGDTIAIAPLPNVVLDVAPDSAMLNSAVITGLGGGTPAGGTYSGMGVTDDGNGMTFSFDPSATGIGPIQIFYNFTDTSTPADCGGAAMDSIVVFMLSSVRELDQKDVQVFPNPTSGNLRIQADGQLRLSAFSLYDHQGQVALSGQLDAGRSQINLGRLPAGVYLLRLQDDHTGNWISKKVIRK